MTSAPVMDTQPIAVDRLTEEAWHKLREILDLLNNIGAENRTQTRPARTARGPWATLEQARTYRVLMLDGPRGTGKTSLLLTLIDQWDRRREGRPAVDPRPHEAEPAAKQPQPPRRTSLLKEGDVGVRALQPLDFDPHPAHLHPYAWLVLAFQPLVDWLAGSARPRLPGESTDRPLRDIWQDLYTQALIGWDEHVQRGQMTVDIDDFVASSLERHRGWHHLRENWQDFIDHLLRELALAGQLQADELLVLPIDDLDLHPSMAGDLLRALRLMRHRRLVFLLTGDSTHLQRVLARELYPRRKSLEHLDDGEAQENQLRYRALAIDIINKAIPPSGRFQVPLLTLAQALSFIRHGRDIEPSMAYEHVVEPLLDGLGEERGLIARCVATAGEKVYRYRDVVQISHTTAREDLVALSLITPLTDGQPAFAPGPKPESPPDAAVWIQIRLRASYGAPEGFEGRAGSGGSSIALASSLDPVVTRLPGTDVVGAWLAVPAMAVILECLKPGRIEGVRVLAEPWSVLMVTEWTRAPELPRYVRWPTIVPDRSVLDFERTRLQLVELIAVLEQKETRDAALLMAWCMVNTGVAAHGVYGWQIEELWKQLAQLPAREVYQRGSRSKDILTWCEQRLPILAAPEFGLSRELSASLLQWVEQASFFRARLAALIPIWEETRREGLQTALLDESQVAPASSGAVLRWLSEQWSDHPWYAAMRRFSGEDAPIPLPAGATEPVKPARKKRSKKPG